MTEAELIEAATSYQDLSLGATALYMSLLSGYLIVAYVAGRDLSKPQLIVINLLFLVSSLMAAFGSIAYLERTILYTNRIEHLTTDYLIGKGTENIALGIWVFTLFISITGAFYFMWSSRRDNSQSPNE